MTTPHLLEARGISKYYGNVVALKDVSAHVNAGEVTCILGDNGAGKSSFIKLLSGCNQPDAGSLHVDGEEVQFTSPRDARAHGIATVYQDLAMVPLMSIWRNFFLGAEPLKSFGPVRMFDVAKAKAVVRHELHEMGIDIRDPDQPVGTLSGGERQSVAIARAVYFGARVLILDEPTSALDAHTEAALVAALRQLMVGRTTLVIAHRLSTVRSADVIWVLDRGQLVETGSHDDLLAADTIYSRLHATQSGDPADLLTSN